MIDSKERCPTGISGFDKLCDGGLIRNSANIILGGPGAGKTTFLLQFLYNGAVIYKENGLYVSFEPDLEELLEDGLTFGWDFAKLDKDDKCKLIKMSSKIGVKEIKVQLTQLISKYDIQRICIDPVSVLSLSIEKQSEIREMIFELVSMLKRLKVTVLLAEETSSNSVESSSSGMDGKAEIVKYLSDSVIDLYSMGLGGATDRALRIEKMRRTNHIRGPIPFQITGKGIVVYSK